jgi:tetratricopeptide (TPR) repeat protein
MRIRVLISIAVFAIATPALAKDKEGAKPLNAEEAISDAELALDTNRVTDAVEHAERLQHTHGLTKVQQRRLDLIVGRCGLETGKFDVSEKLLGKLHREEPLDDRLSEWYARALDGEGRAAEALTLLSSLASRDALVDGDSWFALARLERQKGNDKDALVHAEVALKRPLVTRATDLDREVHSFIVALAKRQSKNK